MIYKLNHNLKTSIQIIDIQVLITRKRVKFEQCLRSGLGSISEPAFWFLPVSKPKKLTKTHKNQETRKLGDLGPISRKPHMPAYSQNIRNPRNLSKSTTQNYLFNMKVSRFLETQNHKKRLETGN